MKIRKLSSELELSRNKSSRHPNSETLCNEFIASNVHVLRRQPGNHPANRVSSVSVLRLGRDTTATETPVKGSI